MHRNVRPAGLILVSLALGLTLHGCGAAGDKAPLDGTEWVLEAWSVSSIDSGDFLITLSFADGQVSGRAPVNTYGGPYSATAGGDFSAGPLFSTKMAGPEPAMRAETTYFALLEDARTYKVDGSTLTLYEESNELLIFSSGAGD